MGGDSHNGSSRRFRIWHSDLGDENPSPKRAAFGKLCLVSSVQLPFARSVPEPQQPSASSS